MSSTRHWLGLVVAVGICLGAGAIGSLFTAPNIGPWYNLLQRPAWSPPNWLFGPVWTALYIMMGVAAWLVWRSKGRLAAAMLPLSLFALQLLLNATWSAVFFGLRNPGAGLMHILVLWVAIAVTMLAFWRVCAWAAMLLLPYLGWVSFAAALNFFIWRMNP